MRKQRPRTRKESAIGVSRVLTKSILVRLLFAEPNNPTPNSLCFWLTARRHELAGNGQYFREGCSLTPARTARRLGPSRIASGLSGCASQSLRVGLTAPKARRGVRVIEVAELRFDRLNRLPLEVPSSRPAGKRSGACAVMGGSEMTKGEDKYLYRAVDSGFSDFSPGPRRLYYRRSRSG